MTDTTAQLQRENEELRRLLREAVNGASCWVPRAIKLLNRKVSP